MRTTRSRPCKGRPDHLRLPRRRQRNARDPSRLRILVGTRRSRPRRASGRPDLDRARTRCDRGPWRQNKGATNRRGRGPPVIIKAGCGGAGGMRVAREIGEVEELSDSATREAEAESETDAALGRGECFVEQVLEPAAPCRGPDSGRPSRQGEGHRNAGLFAARAAPETERESPCPVPDGSAARPDPRGDTGHLRACRV